MGHFCISEVAYFDAEITSDLYNSWIIKIYYLLWTCEATTIFVWHSEHLQTTLTNLAVEPLSGTVPRRSVGMATGHLTAIQTAACPIYFLNRVLQTSSRVRWNCLNTTTHNCLDLIGNHIPFWICYGHHRILWPLSLKHAIITVSKLNVISLLVWTTTSTNYTLSHDCTSWLPTSQVLVVPIPSIFKRWQIIYYSFCSMVVSTFIP